MSNQLVIQMGSAKPSKHGNVARTQVIKASKFETRQVLITMKTIEQQGREAWAYIHTTDDEPETALKRFEAMVPSYGCACRRDYEELKKQYPPDTSSKESLWLWGVTVHNAVNRKLGKPEVSVEEARQLWRMNDDRTLGST